MSGVEFDGVHESALVYAVVTVQSVQLFFDVGETCLARLVSFGVIHGWLRVVPQLFYIFCFLAHFERIFVELLDAFVVRRCNHVDCIFGGNEVVVVVFGFE